MKFYEVLLVVKHGQSRKLLCGYVNASQNEFDITFYLIMFRKIKL